MKFFSYILVYRRFLFVVFTVLVLLPLPIVLHTKVASAYFKDFHLLLIGVICLATSIEKWNLHKRIALKMVMMVGVNPAWLTLGFMSSTAFLSMWLSNTSTAAMVMPIAEAVVQQIINAEAEVEATQMTYFNGSTNHGLEIDESVNGHEINERKEKTKPVPGYNNDTGKISSKVELEKEEEESNQQRVFTGSWVRKRMKLLLAYTLESHLLNKTLTFGLVIPQVKPFQDVPLSKNSGMRTKYRTKKGHVTRKLTCLCIAYSSTIGGLTTITGTSTNLIFAEYFNTRYPDCRCLNFGSWFTFSFPAALIILLLSWIWLQWLFLGFNFKEMFKCGKTKTVQQKACAEVIKQEYQKLGPIRYQEIVTLVLFIIMALLWFSRDPGFVPGWSALFSEYPGFATDSTVALLIGLLFFLIPAKTLTKTTPTGEIVAFDYSPLITWKEFQSFMPWDIAILVGGGFALADGCEESGLSKWIGNKLSPLGSLPAWLIILISSLMVTSLTEVASNPATITLFLPILSPLAEAIHVNPLYILIPSTLCTSFAFLLPVANPPNAIVFSYGHLKVIDMVKAGLGVNIVGVAVVMLGICTWIVPMFDLYTYPSWAPAMSNETMP
ncbi:solute carrier family 13 member 1 isoform X3 [Homo sapiens]|uniref:solute carrier family 13 member 1 isoform X3 n=1 Tax=Homo sapiens TaxID=9606 RepID=UPI0007DC6F04|nr:solute carrier family 13 member 1 isoform X3 [Homo sapiens]XP_054214827.1 solute carrier family 13 member 1 isoform X3 [Homo sapiens]|eukprot:XP_016868043.1 solute carrier family 13 member 1 isoform X3 [Homo sapiens]